jgi:hypothetical protein
MKLLSWIPPAPIKYAVSNDMSHGAQSCRTALAIYGLQCYKNTGIKYTTCMGNNYLS